MKKKLIIGTIFLILFVLVAVGVKTVDVAAIGPQGTEIGFSTVNQAFHNLTGVNYDIYDITEYTGLLSFVVIGCFAMVGLVQWIKRKNMFKVDLEILVLGAVYLVILALYFIFDKYALNYRPVILPDETAAAASFPSSHTLMSIFVMISAIVPLKKLLKGKALIYGIWSVMLIVMVVTFGGRLLSGVHWLSDIVAGVLLAVSFLFYYFGFSKLNTYKSKH